jgi:hypothetical protein
MPVAVGRLELSPLDWAVGSHSYLVCVHAERRAKNPAVLTERVSRAISDFGRIRQ